MDLLGDLGMTDQLTSVRSENAVLQQRVKDLSARVKTLTIENESLKAEVEMYRKEVALPSFSKLALGGGGSEAMDGVEATDAFVRAGNGVFSQKNEITLPELHDNSNNLACALSPDDVMLATGGADAKLRLCPWGAAEGGMDVGTVVQNAAMVRFSSPVITVSFSPVLGKVLAAGSMDGNTQVILYESSGGKLRTNAILVPKKHNKYVRTVAWSPKEPIMATSSADGCVYVYKVEKRAVLTEDGTDTELGVSLIESFHFDGAVEALCFAGDNLICYVRGTPNLIYFDLSKDMKQTKVNLNQQQGGDSTTGGFEDHVSFAILDLRPFQDKYLAAATDTSRNIIMDLSTGKILRNLYGHANDGFSQPKVAWSHNGQYLYGNTQDDSVICVWDIASQEIVKRLEGHSSPIRDMFSSPSMDSLVTTAFDRTARFWFA